MKKHLKIGIKILILIGMMVVLSSNHYSIANSIGLAQNRTEYIEGFIVDFYRNQDLAEDNDLSKYEINEDLQNYLFGKVKVINYNTAVNRTEKTNYEVKPELMEEEFINELYYLKFAVRVKFKYIGVEEESGYSEELEVLLKEEDNGYVIEDFYTRLNGYDSFIRGEEDDLKSGAYQKSSLLNNNEIKVKQQKLMDNIDKVYKEENRAVEAKEKEEIIQNMGIQASSLNKSAIKNYARNNFNKINPSSGNGVVPYYDFSAISGNYDCTNFVSHALLAGGATVYNNGNPASGWYYVNLSNRSYSWSGVPNLYDFLINNSTKGPSGAHQNYFTFHEASAYPFVDGDILQFHNGTVWRHSTIITGFYQASTNYLGALVTGRTSPTSNNDNQKAADIYIGNSKRVIKLGLNY